MVSCFTLTTQSSKLVSGDFRQASGRYEQELWRQKDQEIENLAVSRRAQSWISLVHHVSMSERQGLDKLPGNPRKSHTASLVSIDRVIKNVAVKGLTRGSCRHGFGLCADALLVTASYSLRLLFLPADQGFIIHVFDSRPQVDSCSMAYLYDCCDRVCIRYL
jgi:hypothetical protein